MAFLRLRGVTEPGKVQKQPGAAEMLDGKGTPTVQYVTLYQLKLLGVPLAGTSARPRKIQRSNIQNVETIVHLHYLRTKGGGDLSSLAQFTPSVKYADTTAQQMGYDRSGEPFLIGGKERPIRLLLEFYESKNPERIKEHDELLKQYGFDRDTVMLRDFNIDFFLRPE